MCEVGIVGGDADFWKVGFQSPVDGVNRGLAQSSCKPRSFPGLAHATSGGRCEETEQTWPLSALIATPFFGKGGESGQTPAYFSESGFSF